MFSTNRIALLPWVKLIGLRKIIFALLVLIVFPSIAVRFFNLSNPLVEPHPYRQTMTALVTQHFRQQGVDFFSYRSPDDGMFWNVIHEFPIYQWFVLQLMKMGTSLEAASRLITIMFFFFGSILFFLICVKIWNRWVGYWALACYVLSPFNIIYSRTGLIDFTAQFFMLGMGLSVYLAFVSSRTRWVILAIASGSCAVLIKCYVWFVPVVFLFLYCAFLAWKERSRVAVAIGFGLILQLVLIVCWLVWADLIRGQEWDHFASPQWIFGTVEQRLHWRNWIPQFRWIVRWLLHDWMFIPFVVGIGGGQPRRLIYLLIAIIVLPIVILFNSSQHHDYYLMNQAPYVFAIVGLGWERIFHFSPALRNGCLVAMFALFAHAMTKLPVVLGPIFHDYHSNIQDALELKQISDPSDRIYLEGYDERFDMPLYSERLARPYYRENLKELRPTLLVFKDKVRVSALQQFSDQWVDANTEHFKSVRVGEAGDKQFDPALHIGLLKSRGTAPILVKVHNTHRLDLCGAVNPAIVAQVPAGALINVQTEKSSFVFSGGAYLNLPTRSEWGCRYEVGVAP